MEVGRIVDQHVGRRARRVMDVPVEHLVRGQLAIIRRIGVAGAQRRPPPRLTLDRERRGVLGPDDVALDTGGGLGDERQVRTQRQVGPGPDVAEQVTVDHEPGGIAARVPRAQAHVVDRVAIAGPRRSDAHPAAVFRVCRVSSAFLSLPPNKTADEILEHPPAHALPGTTTEHVSAST